ncbi:MAG TPA: hypothetical protein VI298_00895 [Geobacteraceae bacterium]
MRLIYILLLAFLIPSLAEANAGLPMLAIAWPAMFVSLIPVIVIEAFYIRRSLQITLKKSFKVMTIANLESTIIGIPLTWIGLLLVEMVFGYSASFLGIDKLPAKAQDIIMGFASVTVASAWIGPSEKNAYWLVPATTTALLVPFFFVTWWYELMSVKRQLKDFEKSDLKNAVLKANLITYGLLAMICTSWLVVSIVKKSI